jgi:hypothetical protein
MSNDEKTVVGASDTAKIKLDHVVIRFAGDSGDGMQLTGSQFSDTSAMLGNDIATFPNYPAEIRAPEGSIYGVSGFQVHIGEVEISTPGDDVDVLVAMNPMPSNKEKPSLWTAMNLRPKTWPKRATTVIRWRTTPWGRTSSSKRQLPNFRGRQSRI